MFIRVTKKVVNIRLLENYRSGLQNLVMTLLHLILLEIFYRIISKSQQIF